MRFGFDDARSDVRADALCGVGADIVLGLT
jgi:hypothetical protein